MPLRRIAPTVNQLTTADSGGVVQPHDVHVTSDGVAFVRANASVDRLSGGVAPLGVRLFDDGLHLYIDDPKLVFPHWADTSATFAEQCSPGSGLDFVRVVEVHDAYEGSK